jgi:hypothetical protein
MYTGASMRKLKMVGLAFAAVALVSVITAGQWKSEVSKTAGIVSGWLVEEMDSIRDSETAHFVASWAVKGRDSIRGSYAAQLVAGWVVSGTDAIHEVLASTHLRTSARPWTDASTSHQGLQALAQESRSAESIPPAQPETAAEVRVEEVSAAPIATPVLEGARLDEASTPPSIAVAPEEIGHDEASAAPTAAPVPEETRWEEASAPAAPRAVTRRGLGSDEVAASYMALARSKIQQGDIAAARRLLERASNSDEAEAWFALAETYDPQMLARWGVLGVKPDPEEARALYQKAEARGTQGARERLLALRK